MFLCSTYYVINKRKSTIVYLMQYENKTLYLFHNNQKIN